MPRSPFAPINCVVLLLVLLQCNAAFCTPPSIILILADDLGYGDPGCMNPDSKCPTPAIDRLAAEGMIFTDAHSAGALCVPSRYGLLTGRYPFRTARNHSVEAMIESDRPTAPSVLSRQGYNCEMTGKWHLGFDQAKQIATTGTLTGGPVDRGFQQFFGMHASLDIPPYFFIRDQQPVHLPTLHIEASSTPGWSPIQGAFWRAGRIAPGFQHDQILDQFADDAVQRIKRLQQADAPYFLYVALPGPHTPWLPAKRFRGLSGTGLYGDFVAHVDDVVRRIMEAIDDDKASNTLVLFTSDNGPTWYDEDEERFQHASSGPWRGMKADAWEGGHRVPLIMRWPEHVAAGTQSDDLVGLVDLFATFAELAGAEVPAGSAEDSVSFAPRLLGRTDSPSRERLACHHDGTALRSGPWKLITHLGSGGFTQPKLIEPEANGPTGQLYHLGDDPGERTNLWQAHPEVVARLLQELEEIRNSQPDDQ